MSVSIEPTVAIIGAGLAGLTACKSAIECGLKPTAFEKGSMIGGGWNKEGFAPEGMQTNISRHNCMFSDFEWKEGSPDFPTQQQFDDYLCDYAKTFKIHPHVRLNSEVSKIYPTEKKWTVEWLENEIKKTEEFDFVIVCTGIFSKTFIPKIPGLETFKGSVCHSREFKKPDPFEGKSVVVVGNAFSGSEIASSIATKTDEVINVTHRSIWVLPRYLDSPTAKRKLPGDLVFYSRAAHYISADQTPETLNKKKNSWFQSLCNEQGKISCELAVKASETDPPFVTISDGYLESVQSGKIKIKLGSIKSIDSDSIYFEDGSTKRADAVVFCTGYRTNLSFFDETILKTLGFEADDPLQPLLLYKTVFPPLSLKRLAFAGLYRGPFTGAVELQAKWACMVFSGKVPFPSEADIGKGIYQELEIRNTIPRPQFPHGNYVGFCEDIANQIGVLPDFAWLKMQEPELYQKIWNGPFTTASYRLQGFGNNKNLACKIISDINFAAK